MIDLNDQLATTNGVAGGNQTVHTAGLNWYVNRTFMFNYLPSCRLIRRPLRKTTRRATDGRIYFYTTAITPTVKGMVVEVDAKPNVKLKQGDLLFRIDPRPYQYIVDQKRAALAEAEQNVKELKSSRSLAASCRDPPHPAADEELDELRDLAMSLRRGSVGLINLAMSAVRGVSDVGGGEAHSLRQLDCTCKKHNKNRRFSNRRK